MRSRTHAIALMNAYALLLAAGYPAFGQAPAATEQAAVPRVTVEFAGLEIQDAMDQLAEQTGIDFVVTPGVEGKLTAKFIDEPIDKILRIVGFTLGIQIRLVEGVFILSKPGATPADTPALVPGAEVGPTTEDSKPPAAGAGALLPGPVPNAPLPKAGDQPSLVGGPQDESATPKRKGPVTEQIPVENRQASEVAKALGGGYIDAQGRGHAPGTNYPRGTPTAGNAYQDIYRNLPPGARVSRNGTIMMPNGTTILPSGLVILPNGTVVQPGTVPYITVPYGTTPGQLQQQWNQQYYQPQGYVQGNAGGLNFGLGQNGQGYVQPPSINLGGNATLTLPGVQIGGQNNNQVTQPNQIQPGPTMYPGLGSPNVHYGERPSNWFYGLPPDWHFTPPAG